MKRTYSDAGLHGGNVRKRRMLYKKRDGNKIYRGPAPVVPGYTRSVGPYRRALPGNIEKKYFDTATASASDNSGGTIVPSLNLIPQGTTDVTRIANKITIRNINLRCVGTQDDLAAALFDNGILRVIVYVDKQTNGAAAAVTDILKSATLLSFRNLDQVDRFQILKDKFIHVPVLAANALHTSSSSTQVRKFNIKCDMPVHFSSTTGAITEIRSNNIGYLVIANNTTTNLQVNARVKFTDD